MIAAADPEQAAAMEVYRILCECEAVEAYDAVLTAAYAVQRADDPAEAIATRLALFRAWCSFFQCPGIRESLPAWNSWFWDGITPAGEA